MTRPKPVHHQNSFTPLVWQAYRGAQIHYIFKTALSYTKPKLILTNYMSFESLESLVLIFGDFQNILQRSRNLSICNKNIFIL